MKIYQIAEATGLMSKDVLRAAQDLGVNVRSASSTVEPICAQTLIVSLATSLA